MPKEEQKRSVEDIQREIAEVELETKRLLLGQARKSNEEFNAREAQRHAANKKRMAELEAGRKNHEATVAQCRHRSGGNPTNPLKGGGIGSFSVISKAIMPDGVTILLQCPRCRMKKYTPSAKLKREHPEQYLKEMEEFNRLLAESNDSGPEHNETRGPTFMFTNAEGVPIIPERV